MGEQGDLTNNRRGRRVYERYIEEPVLKDQEREVTKGSSHDFKKFWKAYAKGGGYRENKF